MNDETKDIEKNKKPPEIAKTGYKTVDAVLYVFVFLYDANRKNLRAFINTLLILSLICVCSLYIEENRGKQKAVEEAVKEAELRSLKDITYLKAQNDTLYHNLRDCNKSINEIYQSILIRTQQEKERLENSQYNNKKGQK
jgi:uncharacterized protein YlxW (UPF0749 family)